MTATDVTCMYIQYVLHVCTSVVSIHSGVGIIVLATSAWVMHVSVVYSKNIEKLT